MKKYLYLLLMPLLVIASCEKPEIEPEQDPVVGKITLKSDAAIVLSDEGSSEQVEFTATLDWKAVSDQEWLTVTPKAGLAGDASVTMSAEKNTLEESRNAIVTLTCGEDTKTIEVTQKQAGALLLTQSSIEVAAEGGTVTITAKSNSNATASVDASAMTWITEVKTKALVEYIFNFEIAANESEMPRNGRIIFSNADGKSEVVTIEQAGVVVEPEVTYNIFGQVTCNGEGVADVLVSDGYEIVKTDAEGKYTLQSNKECGYVFITNPAGYDFPVEGVLPSNYKLLSQNYVETVEEVNFVLEQAPSDNYTLLVFGDIHLANRTNDVEQFTKVAAEINNRVDAAAGKVYALTLGDMTWEMYWLDNNYGFAEYKNTINSTLRNLTLFHTMGNHDNEMEVGEDWAKSLKYTQNLAPDYYSFNIGKCHYIVLDNMDYEGIAAGHDNRSKYARNYTASQLAWLKKDLEHVDKSTPVFVTSHEPLSSPDGTGWDGELNGKDADLNEFISIFEGYDVRFLSGHTHNIYHRTYNQNFKEHNSGAVCASWWWTGYMTPGIHVAQDGTPGGYTVWTINGTERKHYYQAALQSADYQFRAYDMNKVKEVIDADATGHKDYQNKYLPHIQNYDENTILVNVWDFDEDWTITITENGTPLEVEEVGDRYDPLHLVAMTIPRMNWSSPTTTFSTCKWCHFFEAKASSADSPVTVTVTDRNGKVYTEEMIRPKAFVVDDYKNDVVRIKPQAEFKTASSSSLVFGWTTGGTAAEDAELPYKIALYKDASCTDLVQSFDIPAGLSKWEGKALRFAFGGLEPSTTYYFVVTNQENGDSSEVVEGRTDAFAVVDPSTVTNASAGTVLLAEDFSVIGWGNDQIAGAIGFIPNGKEVGTISGHKTTEDGYYQAAGTVLARLFGDRIITPDHRLYDWGFYGNSAVYILNGGLRLCSSASGARTHVVTPALSGIPEGKTATVDVTVTSANYSGNDVGVFVNDYTSLTRGALPDDSTHGQFSSQGGKFTGASLSDGYALDTKEKKWSTKTIRISGVDRNSCLVIGSYENVDTKNRFFLDDVMVTLVSYEEPVIPDVEGLEAECLTTSSSTAVFSWEEALEVSELVSHAFTATLYKDAACTVVDQSFDFPAGCGAWNKKTPKYVFGGLQPSTDYWFKVYDTTANLESEPIKCTTEAFTHVQMPASITEPGVVFAEDFGEIRWEFDHKTGAVGFRPASRSSWANTEVNTSEDNSGNGIFGGYHYSSGGEIEFKSCGDAIKNSRLNGWLTDTKAYIHPGYVKLGTAGDRGWMVTPEFTVPEGKKAKVRVTVTACRLDANQTTEWALIVLAPEITGEGQDGEHTAWFTWPQAAYSKISDIDITEYYKEFVIEGTDWETKSIDGLVLRAGDRIAYGGKFQGGDANGRGLLSDMTVEVIEIIDDASGETPAIEGLVAECLATTSSTLAFKWEEDLEASELVKHAFTATLYKDASCTVVDQSFNFPAGCAAWNNKIPKYVFGGLQSATDYWFKVFDTTANIESEPIKCTTDPFTHVLMPQTIASTGVVLAEDFGEIRWGFDHMTNAVGFSPSDKSDFANTAVEGFNNSGSKEFEFKSFGDAIEKSRLNGWLLDTYGFVHPGYIKLGTADAGGWILTPAFTVPEGKKAVVKITVTAARFDTNQSDDWMLAVIPEKDAGAGKDGEHTAYFNWPDTYDNTLYQHIIFDNTDWATKSVQGLVVNAGDRIAFGSTMALKNNVRRGYISDMIVEVLEIVDIDDVNRTTKVSILGDSISTFKGWSDSSKGSAYYPRTDCDVTYVNQTWWHRLIYNYMSTGVFEKNISAGNTTIVQNTTGDKSEYWYGWDFGTRVQKLGLGDPDVIMVFGGTNDYGHTLYDDTTEELIDGVEMGATSFPTSSEARLAELVATAKAATTVAEADALDGTTYAGACIRLIQMLRTRHPEAKIVFIIGDYVYSGMGEAARKIVDSFSDDYVRKVDILGKYGYKANSAIKKFDYAHPTAAGMDVIASYVYEQVGEWIDENN